MDRNRKLFILIIFMVMVVNMTFGNLTQNKYLSECKDIQICENKDPIEYSNIQVCEYLDNFNL